ncbi:MAG: OB-fold domain-containing protein [Betaproteobacteria bacterium]|nr:MAG: OB-fold domain-containing protein [Betaproteobacteria bacterium]
MQPSLKVKDDRTGRYLPVIYPEEIPFWEAAKRRQLKLQRCNSCGKAWYPIGPACPFCFSMDFAWSPMSGRGTLHNYVVYHKAWTPWFEKRVPYAVVQVQLEEGPRLTTNLLDCALDAIRIGMPVEAAYEDVTDEITLLQFRPASAGK